MVRRTEKGVRRTEKRVRRTEKRGEENRKMGVENRNCTLGPPYILLPFIVQPINSHSI